LGERRPAHLEGFYQHDPAGCLIAILENDPVGNVKATPYGEIGFIGELIVRPNIAIRGLALSC